MARLYDRLMLTKSLKAEFSGFLPSAKVVLANNVDEYLMVNKPLTPLYEFPCVAPPFDNFFVELNIGKEDDHLGFHCVVRDANLDQVVTHPALMYKGDVGNIRWMYVIDVYTGYAARKYNSFFWRGFAYLDFDGKLLNFGQGLEESDWEKSPNHLYDSVKMYVFSAFLRFFWVLAFMNTRNTVLIDNPPPAKLSKRHEKKYGVPLVTYKTLKVLPMRKVNQNDYETDDASDASIPKSLHIARGHFKDYRNGPGLFGKFQDIFWWDAHVRGNAEKGVVVKDYDVQAPEPVS